MIDQTRLASMIYLLDDTDEQVVGQIQAEILAMGPEVLPFLEKMWPLEEDVSQQERIVSLIKRIEHFSLSEELKQWLDSEDQDLLDGVLIVNKIANPAVDRQMIDNRLDKLKLDAWLELNYDLTSFEKVKILNHIFFDVHNYKGDTEQYHHSKNSILSSVLERKMGNPILLSIVYSLVAQRLNIPIYGVNLPQHFILGYVKDFDFPLIEKFNETSSLGPDVGGSMMFYINPFNNGLIFNQDNISKFLKQLKLEPKEEYFQACSNKDIVLRILRNLEVSYGKENNHTKLEVVKNLLHVLLGEESS